MQRSTEEHAIAFIREQLSAHSHTRPLFVAIQGPQGIGKSHLTNALHERLTSDGLSVAFLSLDDLYLPHSALTALGQKYPSNTLLQGRGLPGTHDLELGSKVLNALRHIRQGKSVHLHVYDKSLHDGLGDRSERTSEVKGPLDLVIFEGWMTGFYPLSTQAIQEAYETKSAPHLPSVPAEAPLGKPSLSGPFFLQHSLESALQINELLQGYVDELWPFLDCFVQIGPVDQGFTFEWRLQQEHAMKAKNGGVGMSDDQVEAFVSRYMPAHELFGAGVQAGGSSMPPWSSRGLRILVDKSRSVAEVTRF